MKTYQRDGIPEDEVTPEATIARIVLSVDLVAGEVSISEHRGAWLVEIKDGTCKDVVWRELFVRGFKASVHCWESEPRKTARNISRKARRAERRLRAVSPATPEQRAQLQGRGSIVSGEGPCDPAHLWPRALGGCDDALCVVPLTRREHDAYDAGELDLLPYLLAHGYTEQLQHAVGHAKGDLVGLLNRVTGTTWTAEDSPSPQVLRRTT